MDSLVYKINLDCLRKDSQAIVNAKVGETNGRKIVFTLYEGRSAFFVPEGATAIFRAKKPSGAVLYNSCVINDGKVEYTLTQQTVAEQGVFPCEIQIVGADKKIIYTPCITLDVAQNLYSDAEVESTSEFTALTGAIEEVRASKAFTIKLTTTSDGITADKTFTEIAEKVNAAKSVIINMDGWVFPVSYSADSGKIVFSSLWANIAEIPNTVTFAVNSSDVWNVVVSDIPTTAQVSAKYTKPADGIPKTDLESTVQTSLDKAETALQSVPSTYRTASEQDTIDSGKVDKVTGKGLSTNDYTDADKAKVDAIEPVTEQTVSGWGFTKNTGTYSKPTGGIPKADLASDVQASLDKADTALQEHQSLTAYRTAAEQNIIDNGKQDKLIAGENITISADGKTISATGGGGIFPITLTLGTPTQQGNNMHYYYTADRGREEIKTAIDAGITVLKCSLIHADNPNEVADVVYLNFSLMDSTAVFVGFKYPLYYSLTFPITSSIEGMLSIRTLPTKTSELENDSGYLTLATLPKYEGVVV